MPKRTANYHSWLLGQLGDTQAAANYLKAALQDSPAMFLKALRNVAAARQMSRVAEGAGICRESLYRMLSDNGNPTYNSLDGILRTLGLRLSVEPLPTPNDANKTERSKRSRR